VNQGRPHSSWELFGRVGILPRGSEFLRGTHSSSQTTAPPSSALGCVASPMMGAVSAASGLCQSPGSCPDFERFTVTTASGPGLQASVVFARQGAALRLCPASIGIEGLFAQHLGDLLGDLFQFLGGPELIHVRSCVGRKYPLSSQSRCD